MIRHSTYDYMLPEAIPYCGFSQHFTFDMWSTSCKKKQKNIVIEEGVREEEPPPHCLICSSFTSTDKFIVNFPVHRRMERAVKNAKKRKVRWMEGERKERLRELQRIKRTK